jgi:hypothetical protein
VPAAYDDREDYAETFRVLAASRPALLRSFSVGEGRGSAIGDASPWMRAPWIERLRLHHTPLDLGEIGASRLRAFALDLASPSESLVDSIRRARWPELESLAIPASLGPAFWSSLNATGRTLRGVSLTAPDGAAVAALALSPQAASLERLTLWSIPSLTPLETLLHHADRVERLETLRLHLTASWSGDPIRRQLRTRFPTHEAFSSKHEPDVLEGAWA